MGVQIFSQPAELGAGPDWREQLPTLHGERVVLRQMRASDAAALLAMITPQEVSRFISAPPGTVAAFEGFIARAHALQALGTMACFVVTRKGHDTAIGIFQVRETEPRFQGAEWGFAIDSPFWGTGFFEEAAELVMSFAFETLGVHRLEARAAVRNGRGNRALQKIGAVPEGVLRQAFLCGDEYVDQMVYGLVDSEWRATRIRGGIAQPQRVH